MTDGPPPIQNIPADIDAARASVDEVATKLNATIARASRLTEDQRRQRVNDEWSAIESLRHIVFVVDIWLGKLIRGEDDPFHAMGLPPHFVQQPPPSIDPNADPTFDEACEAVRGRLEILRSYVDGLAPEEMSRGIGTHAKNVAGGLGVIFDELLAHDSFINRDLNEIEQ
jgi:hypothetical protein